MDYEFYKKYYELVILPLYANEIDVNEITWKDYGYVGYGTWAHYFDDKQGREYILVNAGFEEGDFTADYLTHDIVRHGGNYSVNMPVPKAHKTDSIFRSFSLYKENDRYYINHN